MITLGHVTVKTYGGLEVSTATEMSGGGTQPPKKAPVKPTKKPKKK